MRIFLGILGLVTVLAIVGVLARQQLGAGAAAPAASTVPAGEASVLTGTPQQQVQQVQQAVHGLLQQERPVPDDTK